MPNIESPLQMKLSEYLLMGCTLNGDAARGGDDDGGDSGDDDE